MIGNETTGETERATTLDRFLSRSGLSALEEECDMEWFEGRWMNFETEMTHLGRSLVHTFAWTVNASRHSGKETQGRCDDDRGHAQKYIRKDENVHNGARR